MQGLHETLDDLGVADMFSFVLADFASVVIESPWFRDFGGDKFDDDIQGFYLVEIVGEMRSYPEGRLAIPLGVTLDLNGGGGVESVTEYDLFRLGVYAQGTVFVYYFHQLLVIVAAIDTQSLEKVGEILREIQAENVPSETIV